MLYVVPTPIGHLRDITLRALDVLKEVDVILCEDTRQTQKLLDAHAIRKHLLSFHDHTSSEKLARIADDLAAGKSMALVTDGGMPVISDPGFPLVREALRHGVRVEALPGPSAFVTALAASGLPAESFSFFAFLPRKSAARRRIFTALAEREETLVFYESPYRLLSALEDMKQVFGDREAVVARELTKRFEEYQRGLLSELIERFSKKKVRGEIVILVSGHGRKKVLV